jgi:putative nucleotidyltransferase with HDIG domain
MATEEYTPTPAPGDDPVSKALNEFYLELDPSNKESYVGLRIYLIRPDMVPAVSFYVKRNKRYRIYRDAKNPLTPFEIKCLLDAGIDKIFLKRADADTIRNYLESFLSGDTGGQPPVTVQNQVSVMRSAAIRLTSDLFESPSPENIRKGMKAVSGFVNVLLRDPSAFYYLIRLSSHDAYTYQHSVGVALHSIAIAKKLNLTSESDLMDLGVGGLLHDIGKTKVNPAIINKPGPLDKDEWEEMRQHASWGYEILKDNHDVTERSKLAMLHHHEDADGTGYPNGLLSNQISLFAKIVSIADIFNALTTDRTYSKAKPPFEAFKLMQEKMAHKFDRALFLELVMIYGGKL